MSKDVEQENFTNDDRGIPKRVYVLNNRDKDMMTITFKYTSNRRSKYFNLQRKATEPLSSCIERIKLNLKKLDSKKVKKNEKCENHSDIDHSIVLSINGSALDPITTKNIEAWTDGAILELNGESFHVGLNDPQVESSSLPPCIMQGFIIMPSLKLMNCTFDGCKFGWYRQISAKERESAIKTGDFDITQTEFDGRSYWLKLSDEIVYTPIESDVAKILRFTCWPSNGSKEGPESICTSNRPVEVGPLNCPFEKRHLLTSDRLSKPNEFRFISYNILADLYADQDYSRQVLFAHCPSHALEIGYRGQLLLKEILGYNADLICLQEVDKSQFFRTYEPFFKIVGKCSGVFDTKGGQVAEGVATFFRDDKFELINSHCTPLRELIDKQQQQDTDGDAPSSTCETDLNPQVKVGGESANQAKQCDTKSPHLILHDRNSQEAKDCLSRFNIIRAAIFANQDLRKRFSQRHTVLQTTLLRVKDCPAKYLIVANTHLYFAPDSDHIRLLQGCVCVKYLEYIKDFYKQMISNISNTENESNPSISIIFCGDMNSTPDCGLYKLVTSGKVDEDLPDWSSNKSEAVTGLNVETHLRFSSAYENIEYTNYTPLFNGCLDYIYYERDNINCQNTVPLPDHLDVTATGGIPSSVFPSDHLALIADLKLSDSHH